MSTHTVEAMVAFVEKTFEYAKVHGMEVSIVEFNNRLAGLWRGNSTSSPMT
jgi:hypothetical protein